VNSKVYDIVTHGIGLVTGFSKLLEIITTSNYSVLANVDTHLLAMSQTKSSLSSPAVAW
jgi:hypothetical protein